MTENPTYFANKHGWDAKADKLMRTLYTSPIDGRAAW